jgi:branched-chain amino acid transport system ATP-binding protein
MSVSGGQLATDGLCKSYGAVVATDDVSLSVDSGECHGIIGPNGSGKTTLFNLVTGFEDPDCGVVRFDGSDITGASPDTIAREGLVRTFQVVAPFDGLTVRENLHSVYATGLRAGLRVPPETAERAEDVLETLDLAHVAAHEASDVSGGQQKLLELGRALMLEPDCLLLDEPTAGVNPAIQDRLLAALREVNDGGTTLVVIEHDMTVISDVAEKVTVLADGQVLAQGTFDAVTADDRVRDAYIGRDRDEERTEGGPSTAGGEPTTGMDPVARGDAVSTDARAESASATGAASALVATDRADGEPDRLLVSDVVAGYGNQTVLHGVSLRSHDGVTCVFGPNGSGKSTLLKAIGGVVPVRSGTVTYGGESITSLAPHEVVAAGITTVPQTERVFADLTVRENLQVGATTVDEDAVAAERMEAVYDVFPALASSQGTTARSLSGGQQVMLGVARAMMTGADIYLLDEPLSGLAPSMIDTVLEVIRALVDFGTQVILVEQHVREALRVADHVCVLAQGRVQFDGSPADLRDEDDIVDLYLGLE